MRVRIWIGCVGEVIVLKGGEYGVIEWVECKNDNGWVGGKVHEADCLFVVGELSLGGVKDVSNVMFVVGPRDLG
jgi:hypothetical protein